jgi:two-component system CheB/CheR fusion protein
MHEHRPVSHLVVVGSSAGGIDALSVLVSSLPEDFPAPIVLAQHLDPTRPSHLDQILGRRSVLPVRMVVDREPLANGTIYVVPANRHVSIRDGVLELVNDPERPKPSVDLLLSSAAEAYGDALIAVILTGSGSDGANGARIVHEAGGVVVIQNPEGADFPSMPRSLAPNTVDLVTDLNQIGGVLYNLLLGMDAESLPDERRQLEAFLDEIRQRFGMDFGSYKLPTIRRRLQRRVVATGLNDLSEYIAYLDTHPEEYSKLLDSFLIKVTEFFRDPDLYEHLRTTVLPELIERSRGKNREIRVWSAGCATGEEAYSLGIALAETLGEELDLFDVRIFATDADPGAISYARAGAYPGRALSGLSAEDIGRYFTHDNGTYYVRKRIRSMIVFGEHDLGRRAPFPRIDLVLCRNVLIYFTQQLQQFVLRSFAYSLSDNGVLVLGKAETTSPLPAYFETEEARLRIYRRRGERIVMPAALIASPAQVHRPQLPLHDWFGSRPPGRRSPAEAQTQAPSLANNEFLLGFPFGIVVVNRSYDIQAINSAARNLLSIHTAAIGEDLIHTARDLPYSQIRETIDSTFLDGAHSVMAEFSVDDVATSEPRYVYLTCYPLGEKKPTELVTVVIEDISDRVRDRIRLREELDSAIVERQEASRRSDEMRVIARSETAAEIKQQQQQIERLLDTNRELIDANDELTRLIDELRARNEELMLMTEEAQAATEEVETLNEELQATNEELETLNEELQATVEELDTTNDELQSRSVEIQELGQATERERARLETTLRGVADAVLVVDRAGQIDLANEAAHRMFGNEADPDATVEGALRDYDGHEIPPEEMPHVLAARGENFKREFTIHTGDVVRFVEATGGPIVRTGEVEGGVIIVRDITDRSVCLLQDEFLTLASHELRNPLTVLQSSLQLLVRRLDRHPDDLEMLRYRAETAVRQTRQLGRLVTDLVNATRLQNGKYHLELEPARLDKLVAETVEALQPLTQEQRIDFGEHEPVTVAADIGRLEQVVLNIVQNAITYAPNTERIDVRVKRVGETAQIEIEDYGRGIPADEIPNLFTRFYQVPRDDRPSRGGLGLGLYISQQNIEAHDGRIEVESEVGKGSTFRIVLPLAEDAERSD